MDRRNPFHRQAELVVRVLPHVARRDEFALKGGTAINLFLRNLPRLSVDVDLACLPRSPRQQAYDLIRLPKLPKAPLCPPSGAGAVIGKGGHRGSGNIGRSTIAFREKCTQFGSKV